MKITKAKFLISCPSIKECPELNLPEFALIGRSNVGKSSFINSVVNIKGLAKTSNTPGKTKLINLFSINDKFIFADLPGYGFAKVSAKTQNQWQKNLENYLLKRNSIVSLIQFIDSRIPLQQNDLQMIQWIKYNNLPCFIVASKTDKISKAQALTFCQKLQSQFDLNVFPFSKTDNFSKEQILSYMESLII